MLNINVLTWWIDHNVNALFDLLFPCKELWKGQNNQMSLINFSSESSNSCSRGFFFINNISFMQLSIFKTFNDYVWKTQSHNGIDLCLRNEEVITSTTTPMNGRLHGLSIIWNEFLQTPCAYGICKQPTSFVKEMLQN